MKHTPLVPNYKFKNWEEEMIWLKERNKELLEACKVALDALDGRADHNIRMSAYMVVEQAVKKAEGKQS